MKKRERVLKEKQSAEVAFSSSLTVNIVGNGADHFVSEFAPHEVREGHDAHPRDTVITVRCLLLIRHPKKTHNQLHVNY